MYKKSIASSRASLKALTKLLLAMKLTSVLVLFTLFQANARALAQEVSIQVENASLKDIFKVLKKQTGYDFLYLSSDLKQAKPVTLRAANEPLKAVLTRCFKGQPFTFEIKNTTVLVRHTTVSPPITMTSRAIIQQREITGRVTDTQGQPIEGVTVSVKHSSAATSTRSNGEYHISVPQGGQVLVFSIIGYAQLEAAISPTENVLDAVLQASVSDLEEAVVVGYGTQQRENITGSVATVRSQELTIAPIPNITNTLAGRLPGLISQQTSGQPGADAANLSIRGFGNALVIVDGVQTDFRFIDPNQVESITILKDASASIFGARAGNGVILVTTKRGNDGRPQFTFNTSQTFQSITTFPKPVNAGQYAELAREFHINSGQPEATAPFTLEEIQRYKDANDPDYPSTNWYEELIKSWAPQQQHNLSIRGGNEAIKYYGFLGYLDQATVFKNGAGGYKRYNFQSNIDAKIQDNLNLQLTVASIMEDRNAPQISLASGENSAWGFFWNTLPIYPAELPDPTKVPFADGNGTGGAHVVSNRDISGYNDNDEQNIRGSLSLDYRIPFLEGLSAKAFVNYEGWHTTNKRFEKPVPLYTYEPTSQTYTQAGQFGGLARLNTRTDRGRNITGQFSLSYDHTFANDHQLRAMALYEVIDYNGDYIQAARENYMSVTIDQLYAGNAATQFNDGRAYENARVSYVGRLNYAYQDKYLLEGIFRADATPVFPPDARWGYFPSVSAGWRISAENFMQQARFIDDLKLRVSYGQAGNDYANNNIFRYLAGYSLSPDTYILGNVNDKGLVSTGIPNPNVTWESVTTYNVGLDFAFFSRKLYGEADAFYRMVSDILGTRSGSLPSTFGAVLPLENINSSNDRGFELRLGTAGQSQDWQWDISGNISWSRSKWDHYDEPEYTDPDQERIYKNSGKWRDRQIGYLADGLFTSMEEIEAWPIIQDNNNNTTLRPGDIRILDFNGDGVISVMDQVEIGNGTTPRWMAGLNATLKYSDFDLSTLFQGAFGYHNYIAFSQGKVYPAFLYEERWTPEHNRADALIPRLGGTGGGYNLAATNLRYKEARYVRLKALTIGYNLPKRWLERLRIEQIRLYMAGTNLLTFDKLKKYNTDPEAPSSNTGRYYPQQRTISFGLNLSF